MINPEKFRELIIRPTLEQLDLWSDVAEWLLLATAIAESRLQHVRQIGGGPARSFYQIEPATARDIWVNFLAHRDDLRRLVQVWQPKHSPVMLERDWFYATALARLKYYRRPEALPATTSARDLGLYWKAHYNTRKGKGTVADFIRKTERYLP